VRSGSSGAGDAWRRPDQRVHAWPALCVPPFPPPVSLSAARTVELRDFQPHSIKLSADVAKLIGVQTPTVNRRENAHAVPTMAHRRRRAKLFKATLPELELGD
jgi:hypothetical protein